MTRNLSRNDKRGGTEGVTLRADMEKLRIQQEQSLGSLDIR